MGGRSAMAALRRAAAAIPHARSSAAPPLPAAILHARSAAAPPRDAAAVHHARSSAAPPRAAAIPHARSSAASTYHASDVAPFAKLTRAAASFGAPAGHLSSAPARFGVPSGRLTRATAPPSGIRLIHLLVTRPIDPHVQLALSRLDAGGFNRYKEIAEAVQQLTSKLIEEEAATKQYIAEQVIHVGTVSWRVCTTVLTVAVAAGVGVLQLVKSGWEREFDESACSLMTSRLADAKVELEEHLVKGITHRRNVARANAFLENEREKERSLELEVRESALVAREVAIMAREAAVAAKEAAVVAKEAVLVEKDAPSVSFWRRMIPWSG